MKLVLALAVVLLAGCTVAPRYSADPTYYACVPVAGAEVKKLRDGRTAYKFDCSGKLVYAIK